MSNRGNTRGMKYQRHTPLDAYEGLYDWWNDMEWCGYKLCYYFNIRSNVARIMNKVYSAETIEQMNKILETSTIQEVKDSINAYLLDDTQPDISKSLQEWLNNNI